MGKWHLVGVVSVALIAMGMYRSRNQLFSFPAAGKLYHLAHGTTAFSMDEVVHIKLPNKVVQPLGVSLVLLVMFSPRTPSLGVHHSVTSGRGTGGFGDGRKCRPRTGDGKTALASGRNNNYDVSEP